MDKQSPLEQLIAKRREVSDLARFLKSRAAEAPAYTMLLGAGCSVSSGVRSASGLIEEWRQQVFERLQPGVSYSKGEAKEYLTKYHSSWYSASREYSSLFERNFDLPRQRRVFIESEVSDRTPNLGYAYLVKLIDSGFLNTIFTPNFDDLINEAFFQYSRKRPMVCAHDSAIGSITVTSKRPKIIKLHGDYLFDDIKATLRETESLEDNIKRKFTEFGREFGLIVVGYSGSDRSIMDVLLHLLRSEEYFKHGVYWCLRKGDVPSEELTKLLWRDRVFYVEIPGFDELMAELHSELVGSSLPIDTSMISDKPEQLIRGFCESTYLNDSPSPIIKRDLERLRRQSETEQFLSALRRFDNSSSDEELREKKNQLSNSDLAKLLEIRQLMGASEIASARDKARAALSENPSKPLKDELIGLVVHLEELSGDVASALRALDELQSDDPTDPDIFVRKSQLIGDHAERLQILADAEGFCPYSPEIFNRRAECLIEAYLAGVGFERSKLFDEIIANLARSKDLDPSLRNEAWGIALDFYSRARLVKEDFRARLDDLIEGASARNPESPLVLRARLSRLKRFQEDRVSPAADSLLNDIASIGEKKGRAYRHMVTWIELDALQQLERKELLARRIGELDLDPDFSDRQDFLRRKAEFQIQFNGDLRGAIAGYKRVVKLGRRPSDMLRLAGLCEMARDAESIHELLETYGKRLRPNDRAIAARSEALAEGDIDKALALQRSMQPGHLVGASHRVSESHDLLLLKRPDEAETLLKGVLEALDWNKVDYGELIINYEIAALRSGKGLNKKRLSELAQSTGEELVRACAKYLLGDVDKAREVFRAEMIRDRELSYSMDAWTLFSDEKGKRFLEALKKSI